MPPDEAERLAELWGLHILDTPTEERFDRITRLARSLFDVPLALVSLVDADRQWFKSCPGFDIRETTRDLSFCAHAILGGEPMIVENTLDDPRFARHPYVLDPPHIRAYLGMPLRGPGGARLGTLCVIDHRPRHFTADDLDRLRDLAAVVEGELGSVELNVALRSRQQAEVERDEALAALERSVAELERLNRAKGELVATVGHEVRTALTGILGISELMGQGGVPPDELPEYAAQLREAAERLARLVDELLDMARLEAGKEDLRLAAVAVNDVVQRSASLVEPALARHTLRLDLAAEEPRVLGDEDRLIQVVLNLLTNAAKYSPDGCELVIGTTVEGDRARIWVRDRGLGIPAEALERIFERFERVTGDAGRSIAGTGLGLPIVREIVQQHGGRVWAESQPGAGSTFHVVLPLLP
jgi:signal transduction histidine kinase